MSNTHTHTFLSTSRHILKRVRAPPSETRPYQYPGQKCPPGPPPGAALSTNRQQQRCLSPERTSCPDFLLPLVDVNPHCCSRTETELRHNLQLLQMEAESRDATAEPPRNLQPSASIDSRSRTSPTNPVHLQSSCQMPRPPPAGLQLPHLPQ